MVAETEDVNAEHESGNRLSRPAARHSQKYLGLYNGANPAGLENSDRWRNMLMVAPTTMPWWPGDGACAGCGERACCVRLPR